MTTRVMIAFLSGLLGCAGNAQRAIDPVDAPRSFHALKVLDITGSPFDMTALRGSKVLVVNTASKCGFTPQYAGLEELYKRYGGDGFTIIGFPSNDFLGQEPKSEAEIAEFCQVNYGVTFPMMSKVHVKGRDIHPVYQWLTEKSHNGALDSKVKWNFQKYLIDEQGRLIAVFPPNTDPLSDEIVSRITGP